MILNCVIPGRIVEVAAKRGSWTMLRLLIFLSAKLKPFLVPGGRKVIRAEISCRELKAQTGLAMGSVTRRIKEAHDAGWLVVRPNVGARKPNTYWLPLELSVSTGSTPAVLPDSALAVSKGSTQSVPAVKTVTVSAVSTPYAGDASFGSATESGPGEGNGTTLTDSAPHGMGDGGGGTVPGKPCNNSGVTHDTPHHHHDPEGALMDSLRRYGFAHAGLFLARHGPDRSRKAIDHVESLEGVRNRGALFRQDVERPGEIPEPYFWYRAGP